MFPQRIPQGCCCRYTTKLQFFDPYYDLEKLIDKCLIVVTEHDTISMHDLMQQMGMEIVQQESEEPKKHRRLLCYEDAPELLAGDMVLVFFYLLFPFFFSGQM